MYVAYVGTYSECPNAAPCTLDVEEALGCANIAAFDICGLVQEVVLDPSGQRKVVVLRTVAEAGVDLAQDLNVNDTVWVCGRHVGSWIDVCSVLPGASAWGHGGMTVG